MDKIFRIRRTKGIKGGPNLYHHADVISTHWATALKAAKEGYVQNWRWIDRFDSSDENYCEYEYLYMVSIVEAQWPEKPINIRS